MLKIKFCCFLLLFGLIARSQVVIDESSFPNIGDTISYFIENMPSNIDLQSPGTDQVWDFGNRNSSISQSNIYSNPEFGMAQAFYPNADLLVNSVAGFETYYHKDIEGLYELGIFGSSPFDIGLMLVGKYSEPIVNRKTPFSIGSSFNQTATLCFPIAGEELPDTITSIIPFPIDSMRFCTERNVEMTADAEGMLKLNGQNYNVLRVKVNESAQLKVEVKVSIFDWQDVTPLLGDNPALEMIVSERFEFISPNHPVNISTVTVDSSGNPTNLEYIAPDNISALAGNLNGSPSILAFPNPSFGQVNFSCQNLDPGDYTLKVFNIIGKVLWEEDYRIEGNKTISIDLAHLKKGSYLYSLSLKNGKTLSSKRLIIIKP